MRSNATSAEVSLCQGLQDGVHGPHVEDEAKLGHTHGDEAQQEDGTKDALHEGLSCRGNRRKVVYFMAALLSVSFQSPNFGKPLHLTELSPLLRWGDEISALSSGCHGNVPGTA